jgi:hypothetical protein
MTEEGRFLDAEEAAEVARIDVTLVWHYAEIGLVTPTAEGYSEAEVAELRRVRRLHEDLGLDQDAIEIVLGMARRIRELQAELRREQSASSTGGERERDWMEADWEE